MFCEVLTKIMEEKGISAYKIANATNIAESTLSEYKSGKKKPTSDRIIALANYFEISADYLLGLTDEKTKYNAKSINNSAIAQGNNSSAINGKTQELSKEEEDIIKIYRSFDFKKRLEFLNKLAEIQE